MGDRVDDLPLFSLAAWRAFVAASILAFMPARTRSLLLSVLSGAGGGVSGGGVGVSGGCDGCESGDLDRPLVVLIFEAAETVRVELLLARTRVLIGEKDVELLRLRPLAARRLRVQLLSLSRCMVF